MKKKKLMRAFDLVDDKYVEEASPKKKSKINVIKWSAVAASILAVIVVFNVVLFMPYDKTPPSVDEHSGNEYYSIIQKLNELTYKPSKHNNLFDVIIDSIEDIGMNKDFAVDNMAPGAPMPEYGVADKNTANDVYQEVTDNQVSGVTEADRIKRSDKHIYYLCDDTLYVYSIKGEDSERVGEYDFDGFEKNGYYNEWEFYLSKDCKTVTVVAPNYDKNRNIGIVTLISLDVSDPANITEKGRFSVTGGHISTRVADGKLLLMTNFRVIINEGKVDFSNEYNFIPSMDKGNGFELLPMSDIITPDKLTSARYTVICKLDEQTLAFEDATALLSYSENVYVSADKIFATHGYTAKVEENDGDIVLNKSMTEISAISYKESEMKYLGSVTVEGYVKDQYSLDEYEGMLRVVTTTDTVIERTNDHDLSMIEFVGTSANLYCISLENYEIVASVEGFAPKGETVRSVRFDGTNAYVCTAVELKDPVFFFDLSDVNNITYKETGTIEGFSTSLVNFGNGYLLGIGRGDMWNSLKIEVYEESGDSVVSVAAYEIANASYSENYKSYYINRELQVIGLGVEVYSNDKLSYQHPQRYILVQFDGYKLREILNVEILGLNEYKRGVYIDGYMYMLSGSYFKVVSLESKGNMSKEVENIVDLTDIGDIAVGEALESFYRDDQYVYFFYEMKSKYVIVQYKDGTEQNVKDALAEGKITPADLDRFGIFYYKLELNR